MTFVTYPQIFCLVEVSMVHWHSFLIRTYCPVRGDACDNCPLMNNSKHAKHLCILWGNVANKSITTENTFSSAPASAIEHLLTFLFKILKCIFLHSIYNHVSYIFLSTHVSSKFSTMPEDFITYLINLHLPLMPLDCHSRGQSFYCVWTHIILLRNKIIPDHYI